MKAVILTNKVKKIIAEALDVKMELIVPETNLVDDLGADSLDIVEMTMSFEEEFGIEISDDEVEGIVTFKNVIEFIQRRLEEKESKPHISSRV